MTLKNKTHKFKNKLSTISKRKTGKKGGKKINKNTRKNKTQKGGWGGFIYGMATGGILYKWFVSRNDNFNEKQQS